MPPAVAARIRAAARDADVSVRKRRVVVAAGQRRVRQAPPDDPTHGPREAVNVPSRAARTTNVWTATPFIDPFPHLGRELPVAARQRDDRYALRAQPDRRGAAPRRLRAGLRRPPDPAFNITGSGVSFRRDSAFKITAYAHHFRGADKSSLSDPAVLTRK